MHLTQVVPIGARDMAEAKNDVTVVSVANPAPPAVAAHAGNSKKKVARAESIVVSDKVAEGGFASVHTAEYRGRQMAVKRARSIWIKDTAAVEQMQREMEAEADFLGQLDHPNIIKTEGIVSGADRPMLLVEKVEGKTLQQILHEEGGSFPTNEAVLEVLLPLAEAMAYLHDRGLIHRDLKAGPALARAAPRGR
eukprot:tig00001336_g8236.t1